MNADDPGASTPPPDDRVAPGEQVVPDERPTAAVDARRRPRDLLLAAVAFHAALAGVGAVWMGVRGDPLPSSLGAEKVPLALAVAAGLAAGFAVGPITSPWLDHQRWVRRLKREILELFAPLGPGRVVVIAVTSAVGEELLFRGAIQPHLGLIPTALVFGLLHGGPTRTGWGWATFAAAMGLVLGALFVWSGGLAAPIAAHAAVNGAALARLSRERIADDRRADEGPSMPGIDGDGGF